MKRYIFVIAFLFVAFATLGIEYPTYKPKYQSNGGIYLTTEHVVGGAYSGAAGGDGFGGSVGGGSSAKVSYQGGTYSTTYHQVSVPISAPFSSQPLGSPISGGVYTGDEPGVISGQENATVDNVILTAGGQNNTCKCGATWTDSFDPRVPPCSCHHWEWKGNKWVHAGGGNMKTCDCVPSPSTPVGDISLGVFLMFVIIYYIAKRSKHAK